MPRPRTPKVHEVKQKLIARIEKGGYRPGDRFLSNRAIAARLDVSYQTADRLVRELCDEGRLERRPASGTYLPGVVSVYSEVVFLFDERAKRANSFGAYLLKRLMEYLKRDRIPCRVSWKRDVPGENGYPVLWERPKAMVKLAAKRRSALILTDEPAPGQAACFMDCVTIDEFCGGVIAGEIMQQQIGWDVQAIAGNARRRGARPKEGNAKGLVVVSGPADDLRSIQRVNGFRSVIPAKEICAGGWGLIDGEAVAERVLTLGKLGIFCCNDRLAEAVIKRAKKSGLTCPPLIGFDDAPVAEKLNLTTISNPWGDLVRSAGTVIKARLAGDRAPASKRIFTPFPIRRAL